MKRYSKTMKESKLSDIKAWFVKKCGTAIGACKDAKELARRRAAVKGEIQALKTVTASEEGIVLDKDSEKDVKNIAKKLKCSDDVAQVIYLVQASSGEISDKIKKKSDEKGEESSVSPKDVYNFFMNESLFATKANGLKESKEPPKNLASEIARTFDVVDEFGDVWNAHPELSRVDVEKILESTMDYSPTIDDAIDMPGLTPEMSDAVFNASNFTELELAIEDIAYKSGDFETPNGFFDAGEDGEEPAFVLDDLGTNAQLVITGIPIEELQDLAEIWATSEDNF